MVFKNPFTVANLAEVKAPIYIKALKKILKEKLEDGETVPFSILFNHVYKGFNEKKSAMFPFLILGPSKDGNAWRELPGKVLEGGKKQKEFMVMGTCTRQGDYLLLNLNTRGANKIPAKILTNLQKLIKKVNPKITIGVKEGVVEDEVVVAAAAGAAVGGDTKQDKTSDKQETAPDKKEKPEITEEKKEKLVQKYKEEKQEEAKKLGEQFDELNSMSSSDAIKKVTANIKKGRTTKKDLKAVKALNKVFSITEKLYKGTAKQVQKTFEKPYKELAGNKKKFYEFSLATKQSKKSLAETLASSYYEKKQKRAATKDEIKDIQKIVKDVILMNKKRRKKAKQGLLFKATSFVLKKTGPKNFKAKYVNQILQKKVA
ncbi:MAG: hypothetical protein JKY03_02945 [Aureispira sp.]|nr:hypothetical protein [Aureispira sp.]